MDLRRRPARAMEPHACTAEWQDGRLTVWTVRRRPSTCARSSPACSGWSHEDVRVVVPPMGGSFGAKTFCRLEPIVAALARKAGRPVRLVLDRDEVFVTLNRHPAASACGSARAPMAPSWAGGCGPGGTPGRTPTPVPTSPRRAAGRPSGRTASTTSRSTRSASTPTARRPAPTAATRRRRPPGPRSRPSTCWPSGSGCDPLELRLQNVLRDGEAFATGEVLHDFRVAECLEDVAERIGWRQDRRGKGLCALMKGMQTPSRCGAAIELVDGAFVVRSATTEIGQGAVGGAAGAGRGGARRGARGGDHGAGRHRSRPLRHRAPRRAARRT